MVAATDDEIERFVLQCARSVPGTLEPKIREIRIAQPIRQQMIAQPIRQQMIAQPIRQQIFSTAPSGNTPSKTKRDQQFSGRATTMEHAALSVQSVRGTRRRERRRLVPRP